MKILVVKLSSAGDVLQTTPLLRSLHESIPNLNLYYLTSEPFSNLISGLPYIAKVFSLKWFEKRGLFPKVLALIVLFRLVLSFRPRAFDAILILHRQTMIGSLFQFSKAKNIVQWGKSINFDIRVDRYERQFQLADVFVPMFIKKKQLEYVQKFEPPSIQTPYIVIAPGGGNNHWSSMPNRIWPVTNFIDLSKSLLNQFSCQIVLVGGKGDAEKCKLIQKACPQVINLCGDTSINQLANILKFASLFIGHDSFAYFLSCAVGARSLGLFGPTNPALIVPEMPNALYIQSQECHNCYNPIESTKGKAYTCDSTICMKTLSVDQVMVVINKQNLFV